VSARHQVKRLDRIFEELALLKSRSGRGNKFSSFGADLWSAISPASKAQVKSGPDVFADALVPQAGTTDAWHFRIFQIPKTIIPIIRGTQAHAPPARCPWHCCNGYRLAKCQGKPNSANQ
jgi:hypothetical protein